MTAARSRNEVEQRDREILKDVIRTYIATGEPVSSRAIAQSGDHGVSPATIRNVMAELEERGYLRQPHTSAGRVPTPAGYHFYVDSLMTARSLPLVARRQIEEHLREAPAGGEQLMSIVTRLLTDLSHQIGLVLAPVIGEIELQAIEFVKLSGCRVMSVVVSTGGFVEQRVVETQLPLSRAELTRISNYLTENFRGLTLRRIRDRLLAMMAEERAQVDRLLADAIELAQQALGTDRGPELLVEGTEAVLTLPELSDVERVRKLLDTFADKARLVRILNQLIEGDRVRVVIGEDSDLTSDLDFSLVATTYGRGDRSLGTLGIFGPSRMEYQHVVPLVSFLGETLSRTLEEAEESGR